MVSETMLAEAAAKAAVLVEALPYIKKFYGQTVVIKYGGAAMTEEHLKDAVLTDVVLMKYVGMHPVLVHGGGPEITALMRRLNLAPRFVNGLRVTDRETIEVVEMVLAGRINKDIVARINRIGGRAVGISGKDSNLFVAERNTARVQKEDGSYEEVDIGFVGRIVEVNPALVQSLIEQGYIPVVAPVAVGANGEGYNVNADTAAGALAVALKAAKLVILTDVEGILADPQDKNSLISEIKAGEVPQLVQKGIIRGGMLPKVECCLKALAGGVKTTHIIDGRVPHSILLEIFTDSGIGTMVVDE